MTDYTQRPSLHHSLGDEANTNKPGSAPSYVSPRLQKLGELTESTGLPVTEFTLPERPFR